jgi:hypothetical protein
MSRPFFEALCFETDGDLNISSAILIVLALCGVCGFLFTVVVAPVIGLPTSVAVQVAAYSFLAGAFGAVLIASVPLAKSKILARATLPGELAKAVASVGNVEQSTDIQELSEQGTKTIQNDI